MNLEKNFFEKEGYKISYSIEKNISGGKVEYCLAITFGVGEGSSLNIPEEVFIEGYNAPLRVVKVEKKAFLGNKNLREIYLPQSVKKIESWAFAQCVSLQKITTRAEKYGKGVFEDCKALKNICLNHELTDMSYMKALAVTEISGEYLLENRFDTENEWFKNFDIALSGYINEKDEEGSINTMSCGEEDVHSSIYDFVEEKRKKKSYLSFMRLFYDDGLDDYYRDFYQKYLRSHTKGCSSEEAWNMLVERFGDQLDMYKFFGNIGCIKEENIDGMLCDLGENHTEAKAFLIKYKQDNFASGNMFDEFNLI